MIIHKFEVKNFIRKIILSKSRRKIYYKEGGFVPQRFLNKPERYKFLGGYLYDTDTATRIVRNARSAGTPRYQNISGNDMWAGMNYNLRSKVATEMKKFFYEYFRGAKPLNKEDYPIGVSITIIDNLNGKEGEDIDNMIYLYRKNIHDALCGNVVFNKSIIDGKISYIPDRKAYPPIIEDDDRDHILEMKTKLIINTDLKTEDTSMVIELYTLEEE